LENEKPFNPFKIDLDLNKDLDMKNRKVFLGGTCNGDSWRQELIKMLNIEYFNPVVENWTPECQEEELRQRETCDYCLYVITSKMVGVYSIAEVVDDSNKRPEKTVFAYLPENWTPHQHKSLEAVGKMVVRNGGQFFTSLEEVANYLNTKN
jgi:hypothetical protein